LRGLACGKGSALKGAVRAGRGAWGGGRGEIRTHETLAGLPVFKTGALNHSATLPRLIIDPFDTVGEEQM
jgi:hypothetical protein